MNPSTINPTHFSLSESQRDQLIQELSTKLNQNALLEQQIRLNAEAHRSQQEAFLLDLLEVFDALESLNQCLDEQSLLSAAMLKRLPKSLKSIQSKLLTILSRQNVDLIQHNAATLDYEVCKVVDQVIDSSITEESIMSTVRQGFHIDEKILRPIEVITRKPKSSK
jgi:molecular chaperone GrpE